jgi:phospholipase/carboxylesterase
MTPQLEGPSLAPQTPPAQHLVVLLHGYGADGHDLIGLAPYFAPVMPDALFEAPNAPQPCAESLSGYQWFAIDHARRAESWQAGPPLARAALVHYLENAWARTGIGADRTVLMGFSQGAMMALHVGLALESPLMGIVAFSGGFLAPPGFGSAPVSTPVCLIHGDRDDVVDPQLSHAAERELAAAGVPVRLLVDTGVEHSISPRGLGFAQAFLSDCLKREGAA